jgi:surfeit locus 1 family protein
MEAVGRMTLLGSLRAAAGRFRPTLWPTLITVPTLIVLVGLGLWQLDRLEWKRALIDERQSRSQAPAIALPERLDDPARLQYLPVRVRGRFLHDSEFYLTARTRDGHVGLHVVTPMALDDGRTLLIDRGWIPEGRRDPATRAAGQVPGEVALTGLVRLPGWAGLSWLRPDNQAGENVWFWVDPSAMAAAAGLDAMIGEVYLDAGPAENPGGWPKGGQTRINLPNDHLQYAVTWFILAFSLVVIYVVYHLRREPDEESS